MSDDNKHDPKNKVRPIQGGKEKQEKKSKPPENKFFARISSDGIGRVSQKQTEEFKQEVLSKLSDRLEAMKAQSTVKDPIFDLVVKLLREECKHPAAKELLDYYYLFNHADQQEAIDYYLLQAKKDDALAKVQLGKMYQEGKLDDQDKEVQVVASAFLSQLELSQLKAEEKEHSTETPSTGNEIMDETFRRMQGKGPEEGSQRPGADAARLWYSQTSENSDPFKSGKVSRVHNGDEGDSQRHAKHRAGKDQHSVGEDEAINSLKRATETLEADNKPKKKTKKKTSSKKKTSKKNTTKRKSTGSKKKKTSKSKNTDKE